MDDMDIDSVLDVPDTPDRLIAPKNKGKSVVERGNNLSSSSNSGHCDHFFDDTRNGLKINDRGSRKFVIQAPRSSSSKYDSCNNLAFPSGNSSSSSPNKSLIFRRVPGEISTYENKHSQPTEDNKRFHTQSSAGHVVDLTEENGHVQSGKRDNPCTGRGNSQAEGYGSKPLSANRLPSSSGMSNLTSRGANKGKEPNDKASVFVSNDVIGSRTETHPKAGKVVPTSLNSVVAPRVTGQKRLVRNGCISPHNIAKAKQEVRMDKNGDIDVRPNHALPMTSSASRIGVGATESITEHIDSHKSKGKEIVTPQPLSVKESDAQKARSRNPAAIDEVVNELGDSNKDRFGSVDELGGWRSTRNRSKKMNLPVTGGHHNFFTETVDTCLVDRLPRNGVTRANFGNNEGSSNNFPTTQDLTNSQRASLPPPRRRVSSLRPQLDQYDGHQAATAMLAKRQKQGSSSSGQGDSSVAALGDSDIVFLGSAGNRSQSSSSRARSSDRLGILEPVIEIDEASPEVRGESFACGSDTATDAMARQIEADEMLARELQEQFYNEIPSVEVGVDDMHMAMALQHEESLTRAFPRRSQHIFNPRSSLVPSSSRQPQSRSSLNVSRRSPHAQGAPPHRMARLRSRFPGRPRTISSSSTSSSRERNSLFPPDMDVDMRMYILEALEAFSDMGVDNNFLQTHREFNENDYEMLLTLDDNNHQHGGATDRQINGLPQSTVQSENLEEACAICLETPAIGDIIRHLPCLHKFHKDCIDPWLRRRTSCPVCKSSIT